MTLAEQVFRRLQAPAVLPEVVTRVAVTLQYSPEASASDLPADRVEVWKDMAGEMAALLTMGFLSRSAAHGGPVAVTATLETPGRLVVVAETPGSHVNLVPMMVRLVVSTHDTPEGAFQELLNALEGDEAAAREAFGGMNFDQDVEAITVEVSGPDGSEATAAEIRSASWRGVPLPASGRLAGDDVVEADEITFTGLVADGLDPDLEDNFLSLSGMQAFLPIGFDPAHGAGDEEFFFSAPAVLTVHGISIEQVYLFELVATLTGGDLTDVEAKKVGD
ncbi:MAG: hypothetical protein AAFY88_04885 [Acidobacteriota bacterium]